MSEQLRVQLEAAIIWSGRRGIQSEGVEAYKRKKKVHGGDEEMRTKEEDNVIEKMVM